MGRHFMLVLVLADFVLASLLVHIEPQVADFWIVHWSICTFGQSFGLDFVFERAHIQPQNVNKSRFFP